VDRSLTSFGADGRWRPEPPRPKHDLRRHNITVENMTDLVAQRRAYAEQLRAVAHLRSDALVEALATVPRERFLGPGPWQVVVRATRDYVEYRTTEDADPTHLYDNVLVAIDAGRHLNNGQPAGLAAWIDALNLRAGDRVVHVGCGTGYYTAVMAEIVGPTGHVVAIDIDPQLAQRARANLAYLSQAEVYEGDGGTRDVGAVDAVDAVFVNAGVTHPRAVWLDALRSGGRLLLPITGASDLNAIGVGGVFLITRRGFGFAATLVSPVAIFPCLGARDLDLGRALLRKQGPEWREVRSLRRESHEPDRTCWLHTPDGCLSTLALAEDAA
jgi:protein-L-isoaspartate(D-aspartate) O-methyltransferase